MRRRRRSWRLSTVIRTRSNGGALGETALILGAAGLGVSRRRPALIQQLAVVEDKNHQLRVLIANERRDRLELLAQVVAGLGHEVIAREIDVREVGAVTARERPDVALVGLGLSLRACARADREIVREAACPVIALLSAETPPTSGRRPSAACSPTSSTRPPRSCRARSTSRSSASPSTTIAGGVRPPGSDRAGEGDSDGAPCDRRRQGVRAAPRPLAAQRPELGGRGCGDHRHHLLLMPPLRQPLTRPQAGPDEAKPR